MKYVLPLVMLVLTILCAIFWACDGKGSGMAIPTVTFALIGLANALRNKLKFGVWFTEQSNS